MVGMGAGGGGMVAGGGVYLREEGDADAENAGSSFGLVKMELCIEMLERWVMGKR